MKRYVIVLIGMLVLIPTFAFSDAVSFRIAYFIPMADSDLWTQEFENLNLTVNDFHNTAFCFSYEYFMSREMSIVLGFDPYYSRRNGTYLDFVGYVFDEGDFAFPSEEFIGDFYISHLFDVSISPIYIGMKLAPFGRRGRLVPFVGAAGILFLWNVRLQGDIIDFDDVWIYTDPDTGDEIDIYAIKGADVRDENKISFGYMAFGGFMYPIGRRLSVDAVFKYVVGKGNLRNFVDYEPFDLSGYVIAVGLSYWF